MLLSKLLKLGLLLCGTFYLWPKPSLASNFTLQQQLSYYNKVQAQIIRLQKVKSVILNQLALFEGQNLLLVHAENLRLKLLIIRCFSPEMADFAQKTSNFSFADSKINLQELTKELDELEQLVLQLCASNKACFKPNDLALNLVQIESFKSNCTPVKPKSKLNLNYSLPGIAAEVASKAIEGISTAVAGKITEVASNYARDALKTRSSWATVAECNKRWQHLKLDVMPHWLDCKRESRFWRDTYKNHLIKGAGSAEIYNICKTRKQLEQTNDNLKLRHGLLLKINELNLQLNSAHAHEPLEEISKALLGYCQSLTQNIDFLTNLKALVIDYRQKNVDLKNEIAILKQQLNVEKYGN